MTCYSHILYVSVLFGSNIAQSLSCFSFLSGLGLQLLRQLLPHFKFLANGQASIFWSHFPKSLMSKWQWEYLKTHLIIVLATFMQN